MKTSTNQTFSQKEIFESFMAGMKEFRAGMAEIREINKETAELQRENAEWQEKANKEHAARQREDEEWEKKEKNERAERKKELDRLFKETREQMKETDRKIGGLGNRFGELAEHLVAPGIADKFNDLGFHFNAIIPGGYDIKDHTGKVIAQVDILLENTTCVMAVEVKTRPRVQDVEHHVKRMEILRKHRQKINDTRKIYGAVAGAVFGDAQKKAVIAAGFYVLEQSGDTVKLDIPADFIPREW